MDWQGTDSTAICTSTEALSAVEMAEQEDCICFEQWHAFNEAESFPISTL